jgi:hypothetical protein
MAGSAKIDSLEAITTLRTALAKFAEEAYAALTSCDAEVQRAANWLESEQRAYWQGQLRTRTDAVTRAKEAVRMKKLFKNAVGQYESAFDEEKALKRAMQQLADAEMKLAAVKRWVPRLQKEAQTYKGLTQRLSTAVHSDLPLAMARLDQLLAKLKEYMALAPAAIERDRSVPSGAFSDIFADAPSMSRGGEEEASDIHQGGEHARRLNAEQERE